MPIGMIMFIVWVVFMALTVVAFVVWAWKEKQLQDIEEPKYRMLEDHEPQAWPGREQAPVPEGEGHKTKREDEGGY